MPADIVDSRVLCLSWVPPEGDAGAPIKAFVDRLRARVASAKFDSRNRRFKLINMAEEGEDKARLREGGWTDFIALCTIDYCLAHDALGDESGLRMALKLHADGQLDMWLLRMELGESGDFRLGDDPLDSVARWAVIPGPDPDPPLATTPPTAIDNEIVTHVMRPLKAGHPAGG